MKIIKCLSEKIEEELKDAEAYVDLAMRWRQDEPEVANLFYQLSTEEMGHVDKLHKAVSEKILEYRNKNGDPPREMMTLYEFLHDRHIKEATEIKIRQGLFQAA